MKSELRFLKKWGESYVGTISNQRARNKKTSTAAARARHSCYDVQLCRTQQKKLSRWGAFVQLPSRHWQGIYVLRGRWGGGGGGTR